MLIIGVFYLYQIVLFFIGLLIQRSDQVAVYSDPSRFCVIIPAHNEQNVIFRCLRSLKNSYHKNFDVYVIADNCSDLTALLAKEAGAKVYERTASARGKQYALKWFMADRQLLSHYDAVVILDADNEVDRYFLSALDAELHKGAGAVQGYIDAGLPCSSWIAMNYAFMYWYICRLQMAKSMLGLSAWLAGTGFCIRTDLLEKLGGFNVSTVNDDLELTCQIILAGERVVFAEAARFTNQHPSSFRDSYRQRLRWVRGQTAVTIKYLPALLLKMVTSWPAGDGTCCRCLDAVLWVPLHLVICASIITGLAGGPAKYIMDVLISTPFFYLVPMVAERIRSKRAWGLLATAGIFWFTWLPIVFQGVITFGDSQWVRTPHY